MKRKPTPDDRAIADRISRERAKDLPRSLEWYERCGDLAREYALDPGAVFEEFDERAAIRQYEAGVTREAAESAAFDDVRARFVKQTQLAV